MVAGQIRYRQAGQCNSKSATPRRGRPGTWTRPRYARSRPRGSARVSRQPRPLRPESELLSELAIVGTSGGSTMNRLRWFLLAVVSAGAIALAACALILWNARGFSARERPTAVE